MKTLKINSKAPNFSLPDQDNKIHSLSDFKNKWVLLYFYPKDDTPGCVKEACGIRDKFPKFGKLNCVVLGISIDPVKSHEKFVKKYKLPFTLLSDSEKKVGKKFMGHEYIGTLRTSFLINPEGKIAKIYKNVDPESHAEEVLKDLQG